MPLVQSLLISAAAQIRALSASQMATAVSNGTLEKHAFVMMHHSDQTTYSAFCLEPYEIQYLSEQQRTA